MTHRDAAAIWSAVHVERNALVRDLERLSRKQWETPSLCSGWTVHDVLAHLVDTAKMTRWSFVKRLVTARFDFHRDNARGVEWERASDPSVTLDRFRAVAGRTDTPPAALATRLVEAFVHGEDIRRPLGIVGTYPPEHVATALNHQVKTPVGFEGGKERAAGIRLVATDADIDIGTGDEVRGTAISLLLALSGRPVDASELTGPASGALGR